MSDEDDQRTTWELFLRTMEPAVASDSVHALERRLRAQAASVSDHDLGALAMLESVSQAQYYDDSIGSGGTIEGYHQHDCATLRALARAELARRGVTKPPIAPLCALVEDRTQDITVRVWAVRLLGESGDPAAFPTLARALEAGYLLAWAAARAMGALGLPGAIPLLEALLAKSGASRNRDAVPAAKEALERLRVLQPKSGT